MTEQHPNVAVLQRLDLTDLEGSADVLADDVVFHFFNPLLPDLEGDHVGLAGLKSFFEELAKLTGGTFEVHPVSITPVGGELVVVQTVNTMTFPDRAIEVDVVVVWRILEGRITEAWDIPAVHTARTTPV